MVVINFANVAQW